MATYSFRIKKGKYQLEVITTDKDLLVDQFAKWVNESSDYVKRKKAKDCKDLVNNQIKAEEEITKKNIETQIGSKIKLDKPEVPVLEPARVEPKREKVKKEKTEAEESLDIFYAPPSEETLSSAINKVTSGGVFDNILENSLNNPKTELTFKTNPTIKKDNAFINFITSKKIDKKIDYLLLTAYYFTQYEQQPRFTLKQLNAKLMQNIAVIIDHSVLQEAINRDYIECLPDLTGLVGASEYRLTAYGEKVLLDD